MGRRHRSIDYKLYRISSHIYIRCKQNINSNLLKISHSGGSTKVFFTVFRSTNFYNKLSICNNNKLFYLGRLENLIHII